MNDFKKRGNFRNNEGGGNFNRPRFNDRQDFNQPRDRGFGRQRMFPAVCDQCHKQCEVPFRPTGDKPIYCQDCFSRVKEGKSPSFADRPAKNGSPAVTANPQPKDSRIDDLKRQMDVMNSKLDRLLKVMEPEAHDSGAMMVREQPKPAVTVPAPAPAKAKPAADKTVKKTAVKAAKKPVAKKKAKK